MSNIDKISKNFTKEEIIEIISSSKNAKEALARFGYKKTNNKPLIEKYAMLYNINISHYPIKGKLEDLKGLVFGKLVVIELDKKKTHEKNRTYWRCKCSCGNETSVWAAALKNGSTKSCGCLKNEWAVKDLKNKHFGDLLVLDKDLIKSGKGKSVYWNVKCLKCGVVKSIRGDTIQERQSFSCNCIKKSKNENLISNFLIKHNIHFSSQFSFPDLIGDTNSLYFDFKIDINDKDFFLIEYQGEQHYKQVELWGGQEGLEKRKQYDNKKRLYCKNHDIRLYEINYLENTISKLKEILSLEHLNIEE